MDIGDLIMLCEQYQEMGEAIQEQLNHIVDGTDNKENIDKNALYYMGSFLSMAEDCGIDVEFITDRIEELKNE